MNKELLEELLGKALCVLIEHNDGSIEEALDDMGVDDYRDRDSVKEWYGWEADLDE